MKILKFFISFFILLIANTAFSADYNTGTVDDNIAIRFYENYEDDIVKGKYIYENSLKMNGDVPSSYLYFEGYQDYDTNYMGTQHLTVKDINGEIVEYWTLDLYCAQGVLWMSGTIQFAEGKRKGQTVPVYIDCGTISD